MIHEAHERLLSKGFENPQQLNDAHGTIGYLLGRNGNRYALVAKEYAYQNLASFMAPIINRARDDTRLIFYSNSDDTYTVFNARYVRENGDPSQGPSKKRDCQWVEISRDCGVDLSDYLAGRATPRTIAGDNQQLTAFS